MNPLTTPAASRGDEVGVGSVGDISVHFSVSPF